VNGTLKKRALHASTPLASLAGIPIIHGLLKVNCTLKKRALHASTPLASLAGLPLIHEGDLFFTLQGSSVHFFISLL